ncbi:cysteine--tRNA ligase [Bradyrhizobium sp. BEA-2-5]|uniref:cysteine--tRNA ligase n=1 Tax=Bradyrhizobium sp. BEA-2-5 TaxID=3080015 RepID=UPI00293E4646|nr:cysteine--tRNA ligase [Bradyrhizobium sp. BEA-2-5]WOH84650.1 cysteine--tRNA ligase [Bradyrhizobium sp. BEA-2-5]
MELRLYDTLSREKRTFVPLDANNVRMYVCGPTVYDFAHIGNGRAAIVFDVLFRVLRHRYGAGHVTYVRNITDVDDKINDRAARDFPGLPLNEAIRKVTEQTYQQYQDDVTALGCLPPTVQPRATEHIPEMRAIIDKLVAGGFAYVAEDHVLFSPQAMNAANSVLPRYGALSNRSLDEMIAGARVDVAPYKKDNTDFVLWKPSKPGEPSWPSPAGIAAQGRPGWHIECSAMAWKHLGEHFDIHGGGIDLVFPHHENEVAQTCCAFHRERMANTWMHNGFLQVEGEKMSKSLGNFFTIRDLLADWPGEVLRLAMLKTHYRSPLDWTAKATEEAAKTLDDWYAVAADAEPGAPSPAMVEALYDDLNTAQAMAVLHGLRSAASSSEQSRMEFAGSLRLLGFLAESAAQWEGRKQQASGVDATAVEALIAERTAARARKEFKESDRIRDQLAAMGVAIKDGKDAEGKPITTWEIAR